jgi:hypothetical protein
VDAGLRDLKPASVQVSGFHCDAAAACCRTVRPGLSAACTPALRAVGSESESNAGSRRRDLLPIEPRFRILCSELENMVSEGRGLPIWHDSEIALASTFALWRCPMTAADRVIQWSTAGAVFVVAAVAAVASYEHAYDLMWAMVRRC